MTKRFAVPLPAGRNLLIDNQKQPVSWIRTVAPDEATGVLARLYDAAVQRAGKVFHVLQIQSLRPKTLRASTALYTEVMKAEDSPLSRAQREMIATVVSRINECHY